MPSPNTVLARASLDIGTSAAVNIPSSVWAGQFNINLFVVTSNSQYLGASAPGGQSNKAPAFANTSTLAAIQRACTGI